MTRTSTITRDRVLQVLDYDRETGSFIWKIREDKPPRWNTRYSNKTADVCSAGYKTVSIDGLKIQSHRLVWLVEHGEYITSIIDHINGDSEDNRISNLRLADRSQNGWNKPKYCNNTSGYKGVWFHKPTGKYKSSIKVRNKIINLGSYEKAEEAYEAYCAASAKLHGEFSRTK